MSRTTRIERYRNNGGVIPKEFIPAIEKGVAGAMERGVLAGYPMVDVEVHLVDGSTHVRDSTPQAFTMAGSLAFQEQPCGP